MEGNGIHPSPSRFINPPKKRSVYQESWKVLFFRYYYPGHVGLAGIFQQRFPPM